MDDLMKCVYCERKVIGRGLCRAHYLQAWRDGNLSDYETKSQAKSLKDRLLEKCKVMPSGCWEWQGFRKKDKLDYGLIWVNGRNKRAHRISYEVHIGQIPEGIDVLHECDNPPCINPAHLFLGTRSDNCKDAAFKDRYPLNEKHHNTKLSVDDVRTIRNSDLKHAELAKQFNVNAGTISRIKAGKRRSKAS